MPNTSIICGTLLILIGIVGYVVGATDGRASVTALIPAFFGVILLLLGVFSRTKEGLRKHLMHAAALVALLGFVMPAGMLLMRIREFTISLASMSQLAMALVCLVFVILAIRSFTQARKLREAA